MPRIASLILYLVLSLYSYADLAVGTWRQYPVYSDVTNMIDTPHFVYYVSEGQLYSYDKECDETKMYVGELSDDNVDGIFYNFAGGYLLVAFDNGNIDLLYDDGSRVNLPEIKSAALSTQKRINDVKFAPGEIYVAASFGLVIYSDSRHEVKQSGSYGKSLSAVALTDNNIIVTCDDETGSIYAAPRSGRINSFNLFKKIGECTTPLSEMYTVDASSGVILLLCGGKLYSASLSASPTDAMLTPMVAYTDVVDIIPARDAFFIRNSDTLYRLSGLDNASAGIPSIYLECVIPEPLRGGLIATNKGASSLWSATDEGVGEYSVRNSGLTVLHDRYRPVDAMSFRNICKLFPVTGGQSGGVIATNLGMNQIHPMGLNEGYGITTKANVVNHDDVELLHPVYADGRPLVNPTFAIQDPDDASIIYYGAASNEGVIVTRDNKEVARFTTANSALRTNRPSHAMFDSDGNMWVGVFTGNIEGTIPAVAVLPADKRRKDPAIITAADWVSPDLGQFIYSKDVRMILCRHSDVCIFFDSQYMGGIVAYDYAGTLTDTSDDRHMVHATLIDKEGNIFNPAFIFCGVEDHRGRIWLGTSQGVIEITNPRDVFNPAFSIKRIKVPRNDGTNLADYLLESDEIYSISVDNSNRKWIGTKYSGLFLVSEDGDEILANYTADNSPLPTNTIPTVYADPTSNSVYVGTLSGLLEFSSTSYPARKDFSDVYAYPNPVPPGYSGWITITGLMDNTQIKIVDSSMSLIYKGVSDGGVMQWDGRTLNGDRVRSGVYYVIAASGSSGVTDADVVTKIMVIN